MIKGFKFLQIKGIKTQSFSMYDRITNDIVLFFVLIFTHFLLAAADLYFWNLEVFMIFKIISF